MNTIAAGVAPDGARSVGRHPWIDALRGFAVFGILLANMQFFSGYQLLSEQRRAALPLAELNQAGEFVLRVLVDGKFYSLFSLLFGFGCAVLMARAAQAGRDFGREYRRRLLVLLGIGLTHAFLLWLGDILTLYALAGFTLLWFRRLGNRALLVWVAVLLALPVVQYAAMLLLFGSGVLPAPDIDAQRVQFMDRMVDTMAHGPAWQIFQLNAGGVVLGRWPDLLFTGRVFKVLAMFVLGFVLGRSGVLIDPGMHRIPLRRLLVFGLLIGLPLNLWLALLMNSGAYYSLQPAGLLQAAIYAIGVPTLALAYGAGFLLLYQRPFGTRMLAILVPVGRLALSNYLLQSFICIALFTGYGFGLGGTIGVAVGLLLATLIFSVQILLSRMWISYHHQGPVERLWRTLAHAPTSATRKGAP